MTAKPSISDSELEVLKVLWERGPAKVREVLDILRDRGFRWAYPTVLTLLRRLEAKGYVKKDKGGLAHVFRPAHSRENLVVQRLREIKDQICEGEAAPLVLALVENYRFSPEEIERFRHLLDELEDSKKSSKKAK